MKKTLLFIGLISIMPLCAMKRTEPYLPEEFEVSTPEEIEVPPFAQSELSTLEEFNPSTPEQAGPLQQVQGELSLDQKLLNELSSLYHLPRYSGEIASLLAQGANPNQETNQGFPCIFHANRSSILRTLLDAGANMLKRDRTGATVFHDIAFSGSPKKMALFLLHAQERGFDIKCILSTNNEDDQTPRSIAQELKISLLTQFFSENAEELTDKEKFLLIMADPNKNIPLICPEAFREFQNDQIDFRLNHIVPLLGNAGAESIHEYLFLREIGKKNKQLKRRSYS